MYIDALSPLGHLVCTHKLNFRLLDVDILTKFSLDSYLSVRMCCVTHGYAELHEKLNKSKLDQKKKI